MVARRRIAYISIMKKISIVCLLAVVLGAAPSFAQDSRDSRKRSLWKASLVALVAATAADMQSSVGRHEANPLLRSPNGQFQARGFAIKAAITGGAVAAQWLLLKNNPQADKYAAVANFGMAGVFTSAAIHNHGVRKIELAPKMEPR
jgi:hypothetical protein